MGKKTLATAVALVGVAGMLALAGCSGASDGSEPSASAAKSKDFGKFNDQLPEKIRSKGTLDLFIQQPNPPMEFTEEGSDELKGIDPELSAEFADLFGVKIVWHRVTEFSELIPSIQTGRGDLVISAALDKKSRQDVVSFVDYFSTGSQWVVAKDSKIGKLSDLCGKSVSTGSGTSYIDQIAEFSKTECEAKGKQPISTLTTVSVAEQMMMISQGRAVANLQGIESAGYLITSQPGRWKTLGDPFNRASYGIIFAKGDDQLGKAVKDALDYMIEDGSYGKILKKWNVSSAAVEEGVINGATTD